MKISVAPFNIYLLVLLALLFSQGCKTPEERKRSKESSTFRLFLEAGSSRADPNSGVPIYRENPVRVSVEQRPFVTEVDVQSATVLDVAGGFAVQVQLNRHGTLILEGVTATHRGRRMAIQSHFPEPRWLAAPTITRPIHNGELVFTPDATREEADRFVLGLTNVVAKIRKRSGILKE
jgi:preprotein translocase subunit SecD